MAFGLTYKQTEDLSRRLGELLGVDHTKVEVAFSIITREEVERIAKNEKGE